MKIGRIYLSASFHMDMYNMYAACYTPSPILLDGSRPRGAFLRALFRFAGIDVPAQVRSKKTFNQTAFKWEF